MTTLERRCRLLLNAYPAAYRRERGEEILGTLLELTPEGRNWPPGRDVCGLLAGAVRARAAMRQRQPFSVNIRTPLLVGAAAFLTQQAVGVLTESARIGRTHAVWYFYWPATITVPLILAAVVLAWLGCKRVYVFAAAWEAALLQEYWLLHMSGVWGDGWSEHAWELLTYPYLVGQSYLVSLACLVGLVVLGGSNARPRPGWLVPAGLVSVAPALSALIEATRWHEIPVDLVLAVGAACIAWIVVDARPTIAVAVFLLADSLQSADGLPVPPGSRAGIWVLLVFGAVVVLAEWRLSRQSAGAPRRRI